MPYLKKIVECINEDLKASTVKGNPLQNSLLGGIARTVSITSTDDNGDITIKKPVEFKDGREVNHLPDDRFAFQSYHKINGITYEDSKTDYGDGGNDVNEKASMQMIVFADEVKLNLSMEDLAHLINVGFPTTIKASRVCKEDIKKVSIRIDSVNTDSEQLYKGETGLGEYGLKPQSIYMSLSYTIETVSVKNCYSCN